jgi:hypothetical protein
LIKDFIHKIKPSIIRENKEFIDICFRKKYPLDKILEFVPKIIPFYKNNISIIETLFNKTSSLDEIYSSLMKYHN